MTGLLVAVLEVEDIDGGHYVAGVVAPGVALVGDHCGNVGFRQLRTIGGHGGTGYPVDHHIDMRGYVVEHQFAALEGGKHRRHPFAVGLVAGDTGSGVDTLTAFHRRLERPFLAGPLGFGGAWCRASRSRAWTRCRRSLGSSCVHSWLASSASAAAVALRSASQVAKSSGVRASTTIGMKAWSRPHSSVHWPR